MDMVNVRDLFRKQEEYVDQTVTIGGWVRSIRNSKNFGFIVVNDGTFFEPVQVVYSNVLENFDDVEKLNVGAAIIVTGKLVATPEPSSCLRSRQSRSRSRVFPHRIIRFRKRNTALST